ncbi:MAG: phosphatidate cytidylyltransferase [Gemmatimonadetes bacterium]|nr:phosphatidate cytidylyltransferase [Gemmatimonadota bacterium]
MAGGELGRRVAVAAVGIPAVLAALWYGSWALGVLVAVAAVIASMELYGLAAAQGLEPFAVTGAAASGAIVLLATAYPTPEQAAPGVLAVLLAVAILTLAASVWLRWPAGHPLASVAVTLLGPVYVGCTLAFALFLRSLPGVGFVLLPLVVVWVGDSAAYFAGRAWGKRKLFPAASPGKTVVGGVAALIGSTLAGTVVAWLALTRVPGPGLSVLGGALIGAFLGVAAPLGDVAESVLKREAGVKDSGRLLPGHGGMLDRVDALLFAFPIAYGLLVLFGVA